MMIGKISVGCVHINAYIFNITEFTFIDVLHIRIELEFFPAWKYIDNLTCFPINEDTSKFIIPGSA